VTARIASLAFAAALASFACGSDEGDATSDEASPANAAREETAAPFVPTAQPGASPPEADALLSGVDTRAPTSAREDRIGDLLDTEPEGEGLAVLIRAAADDPDPAVREAAVIALGDSVDPRALDALIGASEDRDRAVVLAVIDQLGWSEDRLAEDALRRLADSSDPEIAEAASEELED